MSDQKTKNDDAWESLFEKDHILETIEKDGRAVVAASEMARFREPRLMAKFDHRINLPEIFKKCHLAILPISRGSYVISHFDAYHTFESKNQSLQHCCLPYYVQSLNAENIPSETIAVNCALASGMLSDFLGEDRNALVPTVSGRMGSGEFSFKIQNTASKQLSAVTVENSQIEIDAAYEGIETLTIFEIKNNISEDFLVRQLYYPFRVWSSRIAKKVRPVFLVYSNGIFSFYEYKFQSSDCYNSLVLVKQKNYTIESENDTTIELPDLEEVLHQISSFDEEPKISFPQANSFERVINLCELLQEKDLTPQDITDKYAFDIRQADYYSDAGCYLGLIDKYYKEKRKPYYSLSSFGRKVLSLPYKKRQLTFCRQILKHKVFNQAFRLCASGEVPDKPAVIQLMKYANLYRVHSEETYYRRSSTITGWINWILGLLSG